MAVFWTTEIIPVSVTSLIPIILFPILGVMTARDTCGNYIKVNILYIQSSESFAHYISIVYIYFYICFVGVVQ